MSRNRGYALLAVIGFGSLLFVLGLGLVSAATTEQRLVRSAEHAVRSSEAARSGIALATDMLLEDPAWTVGLEHEFEATGLARVTFEADGSGLPTSTNNALGESTIQGEGGRLVPPGTAHLICLGRSGERRTTVESLVALPVELLNSTFELGAQGWRSSLGLPIAVGGLLLVDIGLGTIMAGDDSWSNYEAEFVALLSQGTGVALLVRANGPPDSPSGYRLRYELLQDRLHLEKLVDGVVTDTLHSTPPFSEGLLLGLFQSYRLTVKDKTIKVTVNGVERFTVEDPLDPILTGGVGVQPFLATVILLERVTVTSLFEVRSTWVR